MSTDRIGFTAESDQQQEDQHFKSHKMPSPSDRARWDGTRLAIELRDRRSSALLRA